MKIKIKKFNSQARLPEYAHPGDAGMDLFSVEDFALKPGERRICQTGIGMEIPKGYVYTKLESARGEFGYFMASDGSEKLRRINVRGPAYVHGISLLDKMLPGSRIGDVSIILNSLGVCPPEMER